MQSMLETKFIGRRLHCYPCVTSTMEVARTIAREKTEEGTVIIADEQTSGRGRLGRAWLSPKGSLAMSIILRPALANLPQLIMIASLAVVQTIRKVTGLESKIKWPNDVMIDGRKVCGILIENELQGSKVNFAIVGMGLNINFDPLDYPEIASTSTSLSHESGREITQTELISALLLEFEQLYLEARAGMPIHEKWQKHMGTLGSWIQVKVGSSVEEGKAEAITPNGSLHLRRADESLIEIVVGDVTVIKI